MSALGFDLIHGTMTVDYDPGATGPDALIGRVAERAGMHAALLGRPEVEAPAAPWRPALGRWGPTAGSGLALLAAVVVARTSAARGGWRGPCTALSVAAGGIDLFPKAVRGPAIVAARHPRPDGPGGRRGGGAWASGTRRRRSPSCSGSPRRWRA